MTRKAISIAMAAAAAAAAVSGIFANDPRALPLVLLAQAGILGSAFFWRV